MENDSKNETTMGIQWINTEDGSIWRNLKLNEDPEIKDCAFDNEGARVSVYSSGRICWWNVHEEAPVRQEQVFASGSVDTHELYFALNICEGGLRLAVSYPGYSIPFRIIDLSTGATLGESTECRYLSSFSRDYCLIIGRCA